MEGKCGEIVSLGMTQCASCAGEGYIQYEEICQVCKGFKNVDYNGQKIRCKRCHGEGYIVRKEGCDVCQDSGIVPIE